MPDMHAECARLLNLVQATNLAILDTLSDGTVQSRQQVQGAETSQRQAGGILNECRMALQSYNANRGQPPEIAHPVAPSPAIQPADAPTVTLGPPPPPKSAPPDVQPQGPGIPSGGYPPAGGHAGHPGPVVATVVDTPKDFSVPSF